MIVNFEDLSAVREKYSSEKIVFMGGVFDLMHEGHALGMQFAKSKGSLLVVGVSSDERVKQRKGPTRPIRAEAGRLALVDVIKPVDYSFKMPMPVDQITPSGIQEGTPTLQVIRSLQPDVFVDHEANWSRWTDVLSHIEGLGTEVVFNTSTVLDSSTQIIQRVLNSKQ